jgi:hypothetical protein
MASWYALTARRNLRQQILGKSIVQLLVELLDLRTGKKLEQRKVHTEALKLSVGQ